MATGRTDFSGSLFGTYLRHLLHLRLVALVGQALGYATVGLALGLSLPTLELCLLAAGLGVYTGYALRRLRGSPLVTERDILLEAALDVGALSTALYLTGGSSNPLVSLLLLPVTVTAATLHPRMSWGVAGIAAACYTLLMFFHLPFPAPHHGTSGFELHLWGMWYGFLLSAALVAFFVARIGATLRAHDQALAQAHEEALRAEQLVSLGALAAGTAHELGTPLSTMAVLTADLTDEHRDDPELAARLGVLRGQVNRCKGILARMAMNAGEARADAGRPMALDAYLAEVIEEWRAVRPEAHLSATWRGSEPAPRIVADRSLTQAIHNVMNNAADASPDAVEVEAEWDPTRLAVEVRDSGEGIAPDVRERLGEPLASGKGEQGGLGLGFFLARTVLARLGGEVTLDPRHPRGVCARISLPLAQLLTTRPL
jgi:two-component system sensor histidine kinase RegB